MSIVCGHEHSVISLRSQQRRAPLELGTENSGIADSRATAGGFNNGSSQPASFL